MCGGLVLSGGSTDLRGHGPEWTCELARWGFWMPFPPLSEQTEDSFSTQLRSLQYQKIDSKDTCSNMLKEELKDYKLKSDDPGMLERYMGPSINCMVNFGVT